MRSTKIQTLKDILQGWEADHGSAPDDTEGPDADPNGAPGASAPHDPDSGASAPNDAETGGASSLDDAETGGASAPHDAESGSSSISLSLPCNKAEDAVAVADPGPVAAVAGWHYYSLRACIEQYS